jgi:hypothetical protein
MAENRSGRISHRKNSTSGPLPASIIIFKREQLPKSLVNNKTLKRNQLMKREPPRKPIQPRNKLLK